MIRKIEFERYLNDEDDILPEGMLENLPTSHGVLNIMKSSHKKRTVGLGIDAKNNSRHKLEEFSDKNYQKIEHSIESIGSIQASIKQQKTGKSLFRPRRHSCLDDKKQQQALEPASQALKRKNKWHELKDVITQLKINGLIDIFTKKIKRNNQNSPAVEFEAFQDQNSRNLLDRQGWEIPEKIEQLSSALFILQTFVLLFSSTLSLVYEDVANNPGVKALQNYSLILFAIEIILNFISIKSASGRKLVTLSEIGSHYSANGLVIDTLNLASQTLATIFDVNAFLYLRLVLVFKLPQFFDKVEKLQVHFIENYYNEQYWSLAKVFLFNFCFAHILAVFLTSMAGIDQENNWMVVKGIQNAPWFQKYIWSYYWGTTVMLTVGFGDIVATTYREALCLIFIETFSCIALAYNINCVGTLISNIRAQDLQKSKNFKTFRKLAQKNNLPESISWRINNYIQESINIKKKFSIEEEKQFVSRLPQGFKRQFLKESNRVIFQYLIFFSNLVDKTLYSLAEKIQMHIAHPQQILQPLQDNYNLLILKGGEVGYTCRKSGCDFNDRVVDRVKVKQSEAPFLINLHFITKKRPIFEVKSLVYSVFYFLEFDRLIEVLNQSQMDYQMYTFLRDKNKNIVDEFQVFICRYCDTRHTKFTCPKLHYIPFHQHIINKSLFNDGVGCNGRTSSIARTQSRRTRTLLDNHQTKQGNPLDQAKKIEGIHNSRKNEKLFVDKLKKLQKLYTEKALEPSEFKLQRIMFENTTEMIKEQLNKLMRAQKGEDQVWMLNCDRMKNFRDYFSHDNSCNLHQKFSLAKRQPIQRIKFFASVDMNSEIGTQSLDDFKVEDSSSSLETSKRLLGQPQQQVQFSGSSYSSGGSNRLAVCINQTNSKDYTQFSISQQQRVSCD